MCRLNDTADPTFNQFCGLIVEGMKRLGVPGVAAGILHNNREYVAGFGVTSIENPLPVDPDTLFQIGSTTKTFTATAVMCLVEMGKLDLDKPIRDYLPDLHLADSSVARRVTMRHLLTHVGGWVGDYCAYFGEGDDALAKMVAAFVRLPQVTPLGKVFSYNNAGFNLAGRVIEVITGQPYETVVKTLILNPLDLKMTFFFPEEVMIYRFAVGHVMQEYKPAVAHPWAVGRAMNPASGLSSTVSDMLNYARFHLGNAPEGINLLTPQSLASMQTPQARVDARADAIGLPWMLKTVEGESIVFHSGSTNGQHAILLLIPSRRFALCLLTNYARGNELFHDLIRWAQQHYLELDEGDLEPLLLTAAELEEYEGRYCAALADIEITPGCVLTMIPKGGFPTPDSPPPSAPPPAPLAFYKPDCIFVPGGPMRHSRGTFIRNRRGTITGFRFGMRYFARQRSLVESTYLTEPYALPVIH
jgi:CubicO group peptidase (beta-lactamase class C family)